MSVWPWNIGSIFFGFCVLLSGVVIYQICSITSCKFSTGLGAVGFGGQAGCCVLLTAPEQFLWCVPEMKKMKVMCQNHCCSNGHKGFNPFIMPMLKCYCIKKHANSLVHWTFLGSKDSFLFFNSEWGNLKYLFLIQILADWFPVWWASASLIWVIKFNCCVCVVCVLGILKFSAFSAEFYGLLFGTEDPRSLCFSE